MNRQSHQPRAQVPLDHPPTVYLREDQFVAKVNEWIGRQPGNLDEFVASTTSDRRFWLHGCPWPDRQDHTVARNTPNRDEIGHHVDLHVRNTPSLATAGRELRDVRLERPPSTSPPAASGQVKTRPLAEPPFLLREHAASIASNRRVRAARRIEAAEPRRRWRYRCLTETTEEPLTTRISLTGVAMGVH